MKRAHETKRRKTLLLALIGMGLPAAGLGMLAGQDEYAAEPINYLTTPAKDAVTALQQRINAGKVKLAYDPKFGYLPAVLKQLNIPVSSQLLVFSKTSFQRDRISPQTPRALYFNEKVSIGWVQEGDVIEVASVDPQLGAVFYVLPQRKTGKPQFARQSYECLQCHDSAMAGGVPGHIFRSVYPNRAGYPVLTAGTFLVTDQSPLKERWGGWYVTGKHGKQRHMGNMVVKSEANPESTSLEAGANVTDLKKWLDTAPYLSKHSDIVALMVAEHQAQVLNFITRANYQTRRALHYDAALNKELGRPADYRSDSVNRRIHSAVEPLLKAMLFVGAAPLTDPITGTSGFAAEFSRQGPRDGQNRSLRDLDLKTRLFRYPLSYLIYTQAFDGLPDDAKMLFYRRLSDVLSGRETGKDFAHLSPADRQAIGEILRATKPEFAAWETKQRAREDA